MKRTIEIAAVLAVIAVAVYFALRIRAGAGADAAQYRVALAQLGNLRKTVSATGTLQAWTTVDIKSKAGGRIDELDVDVGTIVKPNQIIAKIDPTDSLLTYSQSKADIDAAKAKEGQSSAAYELQVKQSHSAIVLARAELDSAEANREAAAARLQTARDQAAAQPRQTGQAIAEAKANYDSVNQQRIQLVSTQEQDRATAQAAFDQAVANDHSAQLTYQRLLGLYQKGFIASKDVDDAKAASEVTAAGLSSARIHLDTLAAQQRAEKSNAEAKSRQALAQLNTAKAQIDIQTKGNALAEAQAALGQAEAQVAQARAALAQTAADLLNNDIKALDIESAKAGASRAGAALTNAKATLDQTVVRAPTGGVVLVKYVEKGSIITSGLSLNSTGTSIVQLGDISKMYVNVLVDETDIASVRLGEKVDVGVDAYPSVRFKGVVARIDPQAQVQQNVTSIGVRVEIDNSEPNFKQLKPAMNATCEFIVDEKRDVVSIPSEAIQTDSSGTYVQLVTAPITVVAAPGKTDRRVRSTSEIVPNVKWVRRAVEAGFQGDEATEIKSGLSAGDRIVVQVIQAQTTAQRTNGAMSPFGGRPGGR